MRVKCVECGTVWALPEEAETGKVLKCGKCGTKFTLEVARYLEEELIPQATTATRTAPTIPAVRSKIRPPARRKRTWLATVCICGGIALFLGILGLALRGRVSGFGSREVQIEKVIADPRAYEGQTLKSAGVFTGQSDGLCFKPFLTLGGNPLMLKWTSNELRDKVLATQGAVGHEHFIYLRYRVSPKKNERGLWVHGTLLDVWVP